MIQTVLSFILGFLVAAALALAVVPALMRRAGELTRRRIEASLPMSREEMQAAVDAARAEHAMAMRRLEMKAEAIRKKSVQDLIEINRLRDEVRSLQEQNDERDEAVARLEAERNELGGRLAEREAEISSVTAKLADVQRQLVERQREVEEVSRRCEEASLTSSTLQVELVGREAEIERLNDTINLLRTQRKEVDRQMRETMAEKAQLEEAVRVERKRSADFERKLERMMSTLSSREEKLDHQEREIARLKQKLREGNGSAGEDSIRSAEAEQEKERLQLQVADLSLQLASLLSAQDKTGSNPPAARKSEIERLQSRLSTLMRENKKLRAELAAASSTSEGDEVLRERISGLAAEVVNLTATLEGPDSPIEKALAQPVEAADGERPQGLAERVKALRENSGT